MTTIRICFVGDSLTNGAGDPHYQGWRGRLCERERRAGHDVTAYDLGVRADTTDLILERWRRECAPRMTAEYSCGLVFMFGTNDMAMEDGRLRVSPEKSVDNAREIISAAKDWLPTLWIGPPPVNDDDMPFASLPGRDRYFSSSRIATLSDRYEDLADELGVPYLDLFTPLAAHADWLPDFEKGDGVHPREPGYGMMAERIAGWDAWRAWFDD